MEGSEGANWATKRDRGGKYGTNIVLSEPTEPEDDGVEVEKAVAQSAERSNERTKVQRGLSEVNGN